MVNHARNLLLNSLRTQSLVLPGDEYVPSTFKPVSDLPAFIVRIRSILFGANPDGLMYNFRLRQFMTMLHGSELDGYVRDLDPRITYLYDSVDLFDTDFGMSYRTVSGSRVLQLGGVPAAEQRGALYYEWLVIVSDTNTVDVLQKFPVVNNTSTVVTVTDGLSSSVPLPGSGSTVTINTPTTGDSWRVKALCRPADSLPQLIYKLDQFPAEVNQIMGSATTEPWKTFSNLWQQEQSPYRLCGLLCALIYRMDDIRKQRVT